MSELLQKRDTVWCLTGRVDDSASIQCFPIVRSPFHIGRQSDVALTLMQGTVSGIYAEITAERDSLWIRDLHSTNGTFVNGEAIKGKQLLRESDIVQIATCVFRLSKEFATGRNRTEAIPASTFDEAFSVVQFENLMNESRVTPYFQPIVSLPDQTTIGYEALGRSPIVGLQTPKEMFLAAGQLDLEEALSRVLRLNGLKNCSTIPPSATVYFNTHPTEIVTLAFLESLKEIREVNPHRPVTLEVHESAVTDVEAMRTLRESLSRLNIQLAYDDFGVGQSRLAELAVVRPDVVKFDMCLIRDVHLGGLGRKMMLSNLVRLVQDLNITPLAEGEECEGEHQICCEVGFELGQGFFYGRSAPALHFSKRLNESPV